MNSADVPSKKPKRKRIKKRNTGENALKRFFPDNFIEMHRTQGVIFQVTDPDSAAVVARTWESVGRRPTSVVKLKRSVLQWQVLPEPIHEALKDTHPEVFTEVGCCAVDAVLNRTDPACAFVVVRTQESARGQWNIMAIYAPPPATIIVDHAALSAEVMRVFSCDMTPKRVQHPLSSVSSVAMVPAPSLPPTLDQATFDNNPSSEDDESDCDKSPPSLSSVNQLCETSSTQISPLVSSAACSVVAVAACAQPELEMTPETVGSTDGCCACHQKRGSPYSESASHSDSPQVSNGMSSLSLSESDLIGDFPQAVQQEKPFGAAFFGQSVQPGIPSIKELVGRQASILERCESDGLFFRQNPVKTSQPLNSSTQAGAPELRVLCTPLDQSFQSQGMHRIPTDSLFGATEPPPSPFALLPQEGEILGGIGISSPPLLSPCEPLPQLTALINRKQTVPSLSSGQQEWQQEQSSFGVEKFTPCDPLMWQVHPDRYCDPLHTSESFSPELGPGSDLGFNKLRTRSLSTTPSNPLSPSFPPEALPNKQTPRETVGRSERVGNTPGDYSKYTQPVPQPASLSSPGTVPVPLPDPTHVCLHECYRIMAEKVWSASFGDDKTAPWQSFLAFVREGGGPLIDPILQSFFCLPSSPDLVRKSRWVMFVILFHTSAWRDDPRSFLAVSEAIEWIRNWAFYGVLNRNGADAILLNSVCEENGCLFRTSESSWGFVVLTRKNRTHRQNFWHTLFGHHRPGETVLVTTLGKNNSTLDMNILEPSEIETDFFYDPKNPYSDRYGSLREIIEIKSSMEGFKYVPLLQSSSYVESGYGPDPSSSFFS